MQAVGLEGGSPMTLDELHLLLDYHYWARDRMLGAAETLTRDQYLQHVESSFPSIRDTLVHIYSADWVWYSRWQGESPRALIDPLRFPDVASLRTAWSELETNSRAFLDRLGPDGIGTVMNYTLLSGLQSSSVFWQILQHVVNHGTYHRGQFTTLFRQVAGRAPQATDLIAFYRERQAAAVR
jgi:uncharacterized damage-inducible protein DinB